MMNRWGCNENHSYIDGLYETEDEAVINAEYHCAQRGGKYDAEIHECFVGENVDQYRTIRADDVDFEEAEKSFLKFYENKPD